MDHMRISGIEPIDKKIELPKFSLNINSEKYIKSNRNNC